MVHSSSLNNDCVSLIPSDKLDVTWLFELLLLLDLFYKKLQSNREETLGQIADSIKHLQHHLDILDVFQYNNGMQVIAHLCARHPFLRTKITNGIQVLYTWVFEQLTEQDVAMQMIASGIKVLPLERDSFPNYDSYEYFNETYGVCDHVWCDHGDCTPLSHGGCEHIQRDPNKAIKNIFLVDWRMGLTLFAKKRPFTHRGIMYLVWTDMIDLMKDIWLTHMRSWCEWDREYIFMPSFEAISPAIDLYKPTVQMIMYQDGKKMYDGWHVKKLYRDHRDAVKMFYEVEMVRPVQEHFKSTCYTNNDQLWKYSYEPLLKLWQEVEPEMTRLSYQAGAFIQDPGYVPENATGDFFKDYLWLIPPCMANLILTHLNNKTHPKNEERKLLMNYLYKIKIPLPAVENLWNTLCTNWHELELLNFPKNMYQWLERNNAHTQGFYGCEKLAKEKGLCPFGDIEDLDDRKMRCGDSLWYERFQKPATTTSPWPYRGGSYVSWSPAGGHFKMVKSHRDGVIAYEENTLNKA
jgi:hypothetical protein